MMGRRLRLRLLDLEEHFALYGAYHSDSVNVLIHTLCVWPIFFTALLLLHFTPPPFLHLAAGTLVFNLAFAVAALYALLYVALDRRAGSLAGLLCALCWLGSRVLATRLGFSHACKVVLAAQLFFWTGMLIGHGVFEGRSPALFNNSPEAVLMAPFFVLLEVLQKFFGYEPYPGFHESVRAKIEVERKTWRINKQKNP